MFCEQCGFNNSDESNFCESCGAKLTVEDNKNQDSGVIDSSSNDNNVSVQQQDQYAVNEYYQAAQQGNKVRRTISKKQKFITMIAILIIVFIGAFWGIGKYVSDPKRVAKDYFEATSSKDWSKAYSCLDVKDEEFTSKDSFVKVASAEKANTDEIKNFKFTDLSEDKNSKDDLTRSVLVNYITNNNSSEKTETIKLVKQKEKKFLFFDSWKISTENLVVKSYTIEVPKNTTVTIDNAKIENKYITKNDYYDYDVYKIKNIFYGNHELKVTTPYTEDYTKTIEVTEDGDSYSSDLKIKTETADALVKQAGEEFTEFYKAALSGKTYDSVKDYFSSDEKVQKDMKEEFDYVVSKAKSESYGKIKEIKFSNFQNSNIGEYNDNYVDLSLTAEYTYTIVRSTDENGKQETYTPKNSSKTYLRFTFVLEDNKWKIKKMTDF